MTFPERLKKSVGKEEWKKIVERYEASKRPKKKDKCEGKVSKPMGENWKKKYLQNSVVIFDEELDSIDREKNQARINWKEIEKAQPFKTYPTEMKLMHIKMREGEGGIWCHQYLLLNLGKVTPAQTFPVVRDILTKEGYMVEKGAELGDYLLSRCTYEDKRRIRQNLKLLFTRMREKNLTAFKPP